MGDFDAHLQLAAVYQGSAWSDLRTEERELLGKQPSYTIVDFAAGFENDSWGLELFVKNAFDERAGYRASPSAEFKPSILTARPRRAPCRCAGCSRTS